MDAEQRVERGTRATAALAAASAAIDEAHESRLKRDIARHEGGKMSHDDYVAAFEGLATLRRLKRDLEQQRDDGDRARGEMTGGQ